MKVDNIKNDVTEKVANKMAKELTSLIFRTMKEAGEVTLEDVSISINFKSLNFKLDSDNTTQEEC